ncbi:hypothetical protein Barb4_02490 [Bacteroidales bacterium Barb4]|nr:hypothetical protein Barb4_02490 [Bacteroidales bacterium Barb4]
MQFSKGKQIRQLFLMIRFGKHFQNMLGLKRKGGVANRKFRDDSKGLDAIQIV